MNNILYIENSLFVPWCCDKHFSAPEAQIFASELHQQSPQLQELSWPLCEHMKAQYHFGRIWQRRVTTRNKQVSHLLHWRWQNIFTTWENEWITGRPLLMMFYARHRSKQPVDISVFAPVWYLTHVELLHNAHLKLRMAWNYSTAFVHSVRIITNVEKYISGSYHWCHLGMCYIATCLSFLHPSYRNSLKKADALPGAAAASKLRSSSSTSAVGASPLGDTADTTSQVNLNPASMIPLWFKSILLNSCGWIQQIRVPIKTVGKNRASTQLLNGFKPCETLSVNLVIFSPASEIWALLKPYSGLRERSKKGPGVARFVDWFVNLLICWFGMVLVWCCCPKDDQWKPYLISYPKRLEKTREISSFQKEESEELATKIQGYKHTTQKPYKYHGNTILMHLKSSKQLCPIPVPCHRPPCLAFAKGFQFTELDLPGVICIKLEEGLQNSSRMYRMSYGILKQKCIPIFPLFEQYGRFSSSPIHRLTWNHILKFQSCGSCHQTVRSSCQAGLQDLHNVTMPPPLVGLISWWPSHRLWHMLCDVTYV